MEIKLYFDIINMKSRRLRRKQMMSEREKVKEMRKRKLKRAIILGLFAVLLVRRHIRRRRTRDGEAE